MLAVAFPALVGAFILTMEVGYWFHTKTNLQNTADMAAMAGARQYVTSADVTASKIAVIADAKDNSFDPEVGDLETHIPPISGAYTADAAVQVQIEQEVPTFFVHMFLSDPIFTNVNAVARIGSATEEACVVSLSTSGTGVTVGGSTSVSLDGCVIHSNSVSTSAIIDNGNPILTAGCVSAVGGVDLGSNNMVLDCDTPWESVPPIADPFDYLTAPELAGTNCDDDPTVSGNGNTRLTNISGDTDGDGIVRLCNDFDIYGTVNLDPGTYVIDGAEIDFNADAALVGDDVTLIFMNDADITTINNSNRLDLEAPTTGDYAGVVIYGDPDTMSSNSWTFNGQALVSLEGAAYLPTIDLTYVGGAGVLATGCTQLVANTVTFSGNSGFQNNCEPMGLDPIIVTGYGSEVELVE